MLASRRRRLSRLTGPRASYDRAAIEKLRSQNNQLKEELLMENKFSVIPTNFSISTAIYRCQEQLDLYTKKVSPFRFPF